MNTADRLGGCCERCADFSVSFLLQSQPVKESSKTGSKAFCTNRPKVLKNLEYSARGPVLGSRRPSLCLGLRLRAMSIKYDAFLQVLLAFSSMLNTYVLQ